MSRFMTGVFDDPGSVDPLMLPDAEKEALCRDLLGEFGARVVQTNDKGELMHSCVLPFGLHRHGDASASASLNYKKLAYNCFLCGGGGLLWFIGVMRDVTGVEARKWVASHTTLGGEQDLGAILAFIDEVFTPKRANAPMPKLSERVLEPWMWIHPYVTEIRHVPEATVVEFKIGWDPKTDRIVIPHWWKGNLVGWQTRAVDPAATPRYKASPDFPRDRTIYHYDARASEAIVVESPMSVLSKHHLGWHLEATFGGEVTPRQIRHLAYHDNVTVFMDNDNAGWKATGLLGDGLAPYCNVFVAPNRYDADPADLDEATFEHMIGQRVPYALWSQPTTLYVWPPPDEESTHGAAQARDGQDPLGSVRGAYDGLQAGLDGGGPA